MPLPRSQQVSLETTPYYHCISRCVRRAFLCGKDAYANKCYEHRRSWVVDRLALLSEIFAIDVCAYAVMSNHYHLVLRVGTDQARHWSAFEVAERWMQLFKGTAMVHKWIAGQASEMESERALEIIEEWRAKLSDLSWFMRCLNEHIARRANQEDSCTGRFWEGRFKSQALLDEAAVLSCMAYVDLNPIRAGLSASPEDSGFTSIQQRIQAHQRAKFCEPADECGPASNDTPLKQPYLVSFEPLLETAQSMAGAICEYRFEDYLELVDWTGRAVRTGKKGAVSTALPPILERLNINPQVWLGHMGPRRSRVSVAIGAMDKLKQYVEATGRKWLINTREAAALTSG